MFVVVKWVGGLQYFKVFGENQRVFTLFLLRLTVMFNIDMLCVKFHAVSFDWHLINSTIFLIVLRTPTVINKTRFLFKLGFYFIKFG